MTIPEIIKSVVPNPFDKESKLSSVAQKGELVVEGLNLVALARSVIFLVGILVLAIIFRFPLVAVILLVGSEIVVTAAVGLITIQKIKALRNISTSDNAEGYRNILITSEYYELIKTTISFIASIISVSLVLIIFSTEITTFFNKQNIPVSAGQALLFVFVVFRLLELIVVALKYYFVKNLKSGSDLAQINQQYQLINKKLELVKFVPVMSAFLLLFYVVGVPFGVVAIFGCFMLVIVILSIIELFRISNVNFDNKQIDSSVVKHQIVEYQDEQIVGSVFGIKMTATSFMDIFKPTGASVMGSGKNFYPENTLLITNYRLLMIQVTITGGNKIVGQTDYVSQNFFFNRGELRVAGEAVMQNPLSEIVKLATNDVLYNDIKTLTLKQMQIVIEKLNGEKVGYMFMDREYMDLLAKLLPQYLGERFVVG